MIIICEKDKNAEEPIIIQGQPGPAGEAATITVGTVTTIEPNDPARVVNVGDETNAVLDFYIPKGDQGNPGSGGGSGVQELFVVTASESGNSITADHSSTEVKQAVDSGKVAVLRMGGKTYGCALASSLAYFYGIEYDGVQNNNRTLKWLTLSPAKSISTSSVELISGTELAAKMDMPSGGTEGQVMTKTAAGVAWSDPAQAVSSVYKIETYNITPTSFQIGEDYNSIAAEYQAGKLLVLCVGDDEMPLVTNDSGDLYFRKNESSNDEHYETTYVIAPGGNTISTEEHAWGDNKGNYTKPAGGIPEADLSQAVQTSLGKADSALQSIEPLYFRGAVTAEYDGTQTRTINIPEPAEAEAGVYKITAVPTGTNTLTVDEDYNDIVEAYAAGKLLVLCVTGFEIPLTKVENGFRFFTINQGNDGVAEEWEFVIDSAGATWSCRNHEWGDEKAASNHTHAQLKFTGAVTATYDGSQSKTINIPEGGGSGSGTMIISGTITGLDSFTIDQDYSDIVDALEAGTSILLDLTGIAIPLTVYRDGAFYFQYEYSENESNFAEIYEITETGCSITHDEKEWAGNKIPFPSGGSNGQFLQKQGNSVMWATPSGGSGGESLYFKVEISDFDANNNFHAIDMTYEQILAAFQSGKLPVLTQTNNEGNVYEYRLYDVYEGTDFIWIDPRSNYFLSITGNEGGRAVGSIDKYYTSSNDVSYYSYKTYASGTVGKAISELNENKVSVAQGSSHAGEFLVVGSDGNVKTIALEVWQGGEY